MRKCFESHPFEVWYKICPLTKISPNLHRKNQKVFLLCYCTPKFDKASKLIYLTKFFHPPYAQWEEDGSRVHRKSKSHCYDRKMVALPSFEGHFTQVFVGPMFATQVMLRSTYNSAEKPLIINDSKQPYAFVLKNLLTSLIRKNLENARKAVIS